jgi:signal transduction histidine kinase
MRVPGTLSARIIIGFAVLIVTFGGISLTAVLTTDNLNSTIRVIRVGYLRLALESGDVADRQEALLSYLREELTTEPSARRVETKMSRLREPRDRFLGRIEKTLAELSDIPPVHARDIQRVAAEVREIRAMVSGTAPIYEQLLEAPPLERPGGQAGRSPSGQSADAAPDSPLGKLQRLESRINGRMKSLKTRQRADIQDTARSLEYGSRKMRLLTILWGAIAVLVGVLTTIWATINLRPLRRLRDAAREIARGDYGQRIDETGPREVGDLAREFNTMGSAIQERERELVRTERLAAVGKMAAMITHEVRNPLSSIGLNTELLEEELSELTADKGGPRADEARALCRAIQSELDRLTAITEEYLHFARLPKPKLQEEALGPIIKSLIDFEREQLSAGGVTVEVELTPGVPPVMVDEGQLRQALLNLLRNAGEAVAEVGSGRVRVYTRRGREVGTAEVVVEDDGPGIVEELAAKIFDPFFSTKEGGTGLGLALTHQIIRDHGGSIRVESRPGHGAAFIVALPVAGDAAL